MSDDATRDAIRRGKPISAKHAQALLAELEAARCELAVWRRTGAEAARAFVQQDGEKAALEIQLGQAHERIEILELVVRQAGHAESCALQYGGACSCWMQLVRR